MKQVLQKATIALGIGALLLSAAPLLAQHAGKDGHGAPGMMKDAPMMKNAPMMKGKGAVNDATKAFTAANAKMHQAMAIKFTGNADVDFARSMIPHHQGAIDMAKVVLQYGKDAELRKLAEDIVKAQEDEIAFMNTWLAKNAK